MSNARDIYEKLRNEWDNGDFEDQDGRPIHISDLEDAIEDMDSGHQIRLRDKRSGKTRTLHEKDYWS